MPRDPDEVTLTEAAAVLGVPVQTVYAWRRRHPGSFPDPVDQVGRSALFSLTAIREWVENRQ